MSQPPCPNHGTKVQGDGKMSRSTAYLLRLSRAGTDPFLRLFPGLVKRKQPCLSTTLDQLIRFRDKLGGEHPARELGIGSDGVGLWVPRDLCNLRCRENEGSGELDVRVYSRSTLKPVCEKQFCVVFTYG